MKQAISPEDLAVTQMLNAFQRDGRAILEQLLPSLHQPKGCPDAMVEGWGDVHAGRSGASTVTLVSAKCAPPDDRKKLLAQIHLGRDADQAWTATISVVSSPDTTCAWPPPGAEIDWWVTQREHIRTRIAQYRRPAKVAAL